MEAKIVGFILIVIGGLQAVKTDWFIRFQIWTQKTLMGADYIPSAKTYKIARIIGAAIMIMGLSVAVWGK